MANMKDKHKIFLRLIMASSFIAAISFMLTFIFAVQSVAVNEGLPNKLNENEELIKGFSDVFELSKNQEIKITDVSDKTLAFELKTNGVSEPNRSYSKEDLEKALEGRVTDPSIINEYDMRPRERVDISFYIFIVAMVVTILLMIYDSKMIGESETKKEKQVNGKDKDGI